MSKFIKVVIAAFALLLFLAALSLTNAPVDTDSAVGQKLDCTGYDCQFVETDEFLQILKQDRQEEWVAAKRSSEELARE